MFTDRYSNPTQISLGGAGGSNQWLDYVNNMSRNDNIIERFLNPAYGENEAFAREMYGMSQEQDFTEYMWNLNNQYNSPANQLKLFKEAGLNPLLAAGGIAGAGTSTAQAMTGGSATAGSPNTSNNPLDVLDTIINGVSKGTEAAKGLGELFGFGKKNKAEIKQIEEATRDLKQSANLKEQEWKKIDRCFEDLVATIKADRNIAEQNFKNLQKTWDLYDAQIKKEKSTTRLIDEQTRTQEQETNKLKYENWELEFKKQFRELFGVQLNESDASMLAQLVLNGHGEELINAIAKMFKNTATGIIDEIPNVQDTVKDIVDKVKKTDMGERFNKWVQDRRIKRHEKEAAKLKKHLESQWAKYGKYWQERGIYKDKEDFIRKRVHQAKKQNGYSGRW